MHREGEIIDPQSYMFQLTINAPIEKGYTHEKIINIIRSKFKTNIYFCLADEKGERYHTHKNAEGMYPKMSLMLRNLENGN